MDLQFTTRCICWCHNAVIACVTELHEQRMKKLRDLVKTLDEDDWMYPSVDKLLGIK